MEISLFMWYIKFVVFILLSQLQNCFAWEKGEEMYKGASLGLVLLMGGNGNRFGGGIPKQFLMLQGRPVYLHTLQVFLDLRIFDEIVLACHGDWIGLVCDEAPFATVVLGGATRQESSYLGLKGFKYPPDIVMVHDAVRPFVSEKVIRDNIDGALIHGAVDTCIPSADTLVYSVNGKTIDAIPKREEFLRGQTPQTFRFKLLMDAHVEAIASNVQSVSDDCRLVLKRNVPVFVVPGSEDNIKITTSFDLLISNYLTSSKLVHFN